MKPEVGKKVRDTKPEYQGDVGTIEEIQHTRKGEYVLVKWDENTAHGEGTYRRYRPKNFGMLGRFKSL